MTLLEIRELSKSFGGLNAVDQVSMELIKGEILGLIGPNGAGKTTLFNLITGFIRPNKGRIKLRGEDITGLKANEIAAKGIVRTFQASNTLFQQKMVWENILIASHLKYRSGLLRTLINTPFIQAEENNIKNQALELIDSIGLSAVQNEYAANLPHGYQRLLGVCLALAANPTILLLDEPVTGLTPEETSAFMNYIKKLRDNGLTILLVEHNMKAVMNTCDRIVVLNYGKKIAEGSPDLISKNESVIRAYLGVDINVT